LEAQGAKVFVSYLRDYLRTRDTESPEFHEPRAKTPDAPAFECDLSDPATIPELFDQAEAAVGPVEILVHNAAASEGDTFRAEERDRFGRPMNGLSAEAHDYHFAV